MVSLVNTRLGQYELVAELGRGSSATVYKAYQPSLNRYVALKVLRRNRDPELAARFRREAQAIAQLQHHHILPIYDYGEQGELRYFVMQYIENGQTLGDMLLHGLLSQPQALRLIGHLLDALDYAHSRGVIHRDIKPANILMPSPTWLMLADFGIAKIVNDNEQLTPPGYTVGTAAYMAPERALSQTADARTDLYAVGVVLYELLTGQVPFTGDTPLAVLTKHVHEAPPPPRSLNPTLDKELEVLVLRTLEKDPVARFQSAAELADAIRQATRQLERRVAQEQLQRLLQQQPPASEQAQTPAPNDPYRTVTLETLTLAPPLKSQRRRLGGIRQLLIGALLVLALLAALLALGMQTPIDTQASAPAGDEPQAPTKALPFLGSQRSAEPAVAPTLTAVLSPTPLLITAIPTNAQAPLASVRLRLEDTDWQGGFQYPDRPTSYAGRTATWIYGTATEFSSMQTQIDLHSQPVGQATLFVEGMDSEGRTKTPISISVNDVEIFSGPNPLPDDDQPLETGTWATQAWTFDAVLLQPGRNTIRINNLAVGAFSLPPFFMLDYAEVTYTPGEQ